MAGIHGSMHASFASKVQSFSGLAARPASRGEQFASDQLHHPLLDNFGLFRRGETRPNFRE